MNIPDLSTLSREELLDLQDQIAKAIQAQEAKRREEALDAARKAAQDAGFTLDDLMQKPTAAAPAARGATRKTRAPSTVLYANPQDASQTWNGRGRPPRWFQDAIQNGAAKEDLIKR